MNQLDNTIPIDNQIDTLKAVVASKARSKTSICKDFGLSFYELNKKLGCGYVKHGKRGRPRKIPALSS